VPRARTYFSHIGSEYHALNATSDYIASPFRRLGGIPRSSQDVCLMRFVPDGPDIPNPLIRSWRAGKVLFLAGAGVSVPSGLPQFEELALKVYELIGESMHVTLRAARKLVLPSGRAKLFDQARLTPERRAEAGLFLDKQFDRFFSALEKRIDPDKNGRAKFRHVRDAVDKLLSQGAHGTSHRDLLRLSLAKNPFSDPTKSHCCRIVTTNFDLLLEEAWHAEFGSPPKSFDARVAPRPGSRDFEGIVHLHGKLQAGAPDSDYVLSSRDFARVYLRSGTIGNYVYDLIRRYQLVLIGYSADDPPMRYLMDAIGEDASLFPDMTRPYAVTDIPPKSTEIDTARLRAIWSTKEIEPLFFEKRIGAKNGYAALWESINLWADWARSEMSWVEQQLISNTDGLRVRPETSRRIAEFSEHEAD
jgi:hypothetical protein